MNKKQRRWEVSLHECGHVLAAMKLAAAPINCSAVLLPSGGGLSTTPRNRSHVNEAIILASGQYGEELAGRFDPPSLPAREDASDGNRRTREEEEYVQHAPIVHARNETDAMRIAKTCVLRHPEDPTDWIFSYKNIHQQARDLIDDNALAVVAMARKLFQQGVITVGEDDEQEFESRQSVAACRTETQHGRSQNDYTRKNASEEDTGNRRNQGRVLERSTG